MHSNFSKLRLDNYAHLCQRIDEKAELSVATLSFLATYTQNTLIN